jgi:TonB family protein
VRFAKLFSGTRFWEGTASAVPQEASRNSPSAPEGRDLIFAKQIVNPGVIVLLVVLMLAGFATAQETTRKLIAKTAPTYPEMAKKMHLTGKVKLEILISPGGAVTSAKLAGGSPVFEKSALDAVKQWHFEPADKETRTVVVLEFADR